MALTQHACSSVLVLAHAELAFRSRTSCLQVLEKLPVHLVERLCGACDVSLNHKLAVLPSALHPHALLATFPSINRGGSLELEGVAEGWWLSAATFSAAFTALSTLQRLQHLSINCYFLKGALNTPSVAHALSTSLSSLTSLRSVEFGRVSPVVPSLDSCAANSVWGAVGSLTSLTSVVLREAQLTQQQLDSIVEALQSLTRLHRLCINLSQLTGEHEKLDCEVSCLVSQIVSIAVMYDVRDHLHALRNSLFFFFTSLQPASLNCTSEQGSACRMSHPL